jgi:hypothetical protein
MRFKWTLREGFGLRLVKSVDKWLESCWRIHIAGKSTFTYCKVCCAISNGLVFGGTYQRNADAGLWLHGEVLGELLGGLPGG